MRQEAPQKERAPFLPEDPTPAPQAGGYGAPDDDPRGAVRKKGTDAMEEERGGRR